MHNDGEQPRHDPGQRASATPQNVHDAQRRAPIMMLGDSGRVHRGGVGAVGKSADAATATSLAAAGDLSTAVVTAFLR